MQLLHSIRIRLAQLLAPAGHVVVPQVRIRAPRRITTTHGPPGLMFYKKNMPVCWANLDNPGNTSSAEEIISDILNDGFTGT